MPNLAFVDLETTGRDPIRNEVIEAAVIRVDGHTLDAFEERCVRIHPTRPENADPEAVRVTGYDPATWGGGGGIALRAALEQLTPLMAGACLAGHYIGGFDRPFLVESYRRAELALPCFGHRLLDTQSLCWPLLQRGEVKSLSLESLCDYYGISNAGAHGALVDARRSLEVARVRLLCRCQFEAGDSPCPVHGDTECPYCGESYVAKTGHDCQPAKVEVFHFEKAAQEG